MRVCVYVRVRGGGGEIWEGRLLSCDGFMSALEAAQTIKGQRRCYGTRWPAGAGAHSCPSRPSCGGVTCLLSRRPPALEPPPLPLAGRILTGGPWQRAPPPAAAPGPPRPALETRGTQSWDEPSLFHCRSEMVVPTLCPREPHSRQPTQPLPPPPGCSWAPGPYLAQGSAPAHPFQVITSPVQPPPCQWASPPHLATCTLIYRSFTQTPGHGSPCSEPRGFRSL